MTRPIHQDAVRMAPRGLASRGAAACLLRDGLLCVGLFVSLGVGLNAAQAQPADSRYSLTYTPGTGLQVDSGLDPTRFSSASPAGVGLSGPESTATTLRDWRYQLTLRAESVPSSLIGADLEAETLSTRLVELEGGYHQQLGAGFGYGLNLGLGMTSQPEWNDLGPARESTVYFTDLSFGPTFSSGRFDSQFRVGMRQPIGDSRTSDPGHGDRHRHLDRGAGYLSLDGRLRLQNQSELSLSLYYDDYSLNTARDWMDDRLDFEGASPESSSMFGLEMGLTF